MLPPPHARESNILSGGAVAFTSRRAAAAKSGKPADIAAPTDSFERALRDRRGLDRASAAVPIVRGLSLRRLFETPCSAQRDCGVQQP